MRKRTRSITEAKADISNAADEAFKDGPQTVDHRDGESAVIVSEADGDLPERRPARAIARDFS